MKSISIVTGGSSGLGLCLAQKLVQRGNNVAIIARDSKRIDDALNRIKGSTEAEVKAYCGDISNESFVKEFFKSLSQEYEIKYLFNCAGVGTFGKPEDNTLSKIETAFSASLIGLILMSSNALSYMKEKGGNIINIMSTASLKGNPLESIYCAAKWGARGFTESLRSYTKGSNINIIAIYPGGMNTSFWSPECGLTPDVHKFMDPNEVAEEIINSVIERATMYVGEMTIERK